MSDTSTATVWDGAWVRSWADVSARQAKKRACAAAPLTTIEHCLNLPKNYSAAHVKRRRQNHAGSPQLYTNKMHTTRAIAMVPS